MGKDKQLDPESTAALEIANMDRMNDGNVVSEQDHKESLIAKTYRMMGRIETADIFEKISAGGKIMWLKQVKESKIYKEIPSIGTWQKFCDSTGLSRGKIDEDLLNLDAFGEDFFSAQAQLCLDRTTLRKLRKTTDTQIEFKPDVIVVGNEEIPLSDNDDLQDAISQVIEEKDAVIKEQKANLRAKERVSRDKEKKIESLVKDLEKHEVKTSLESGEEDQLKEIESMKSTFTGLSLLTDTDNNLYLYNASARVKSAFIEMLGNMKRIVITQYNTAVEGFGTPEEMPEERWTPGLKDQETDDSPDNLNV